MAATLGNYDATLFAAEGLQILKKALGMANRVHRGFDAERRTYNKGSVIAITRPGTFTAAAAPATAVDLVGESVNLTLDQDFEVKFKLTDKQYAYSGEKFITDHIAPAVYAIADKVDQGGTALYKSVPNFYDVAGGASTTAVVADVTALKRVMFDARVPWSDPSKLHLMIDGGAQGSLEALQAFSQAQGAGPDAMATLHGGGLGNKFGFNVFANQNVSSHTKGTCTDTSLFVNNASGYAAGSTTMALDNGGSAITDSVTIVAGDVLSIAHAGGTRYYAVTALATEASDGFATVTFTPGLAEAVVDNDAVTARYDNHVAMLGFHSNAFALAFAKLPDYEEFGAASGYSAASIQDPDTGLALRIVLYAMPDLGEIRCKVGALWGWQVLNPYLAARLCG